MTVALVIIGDEVLAGHVRDANTPSLAGRLRELGYRLSEVRMIPDDKVKIVRTLTELSGRGGPGGAGGARSEVPTHIIVCGGLGPTHDDVTAEAAADALGVPLVRSEAMVERIRQFYAARRYCLLGGQWADDDQCLILGDQFGVRSNRRLSL